MSIAVVQVGCTRTNRPRSPTLELESEGQPPSDPAYALRATVLEGYGHLTLGNTEAYASNFAPGVPIVLIGLGARDAMVRRFRVRSQIDRRIFQNDGTMVYSNDLRVHLSNDGSVGWVEDSVSYRVPYQGRVASVPVRFTAVFIRDIDRWAMVVEHVSYAVAPSAVIEKALAGRGPIPRRLGTMSEASPIQEQIRTALHDLYMSSHQEASTRLWETGVSATRILPGVNFVYRGKNVQNAPFVSDIFGEGSIVTVGEHHIFLARNRRISWTVAYLTVAVQVGDKIAPIHVRSTCLFRLGPGGWRLAQEHLSVPIERTALRQWVFGE